MGVAVVASLTPTAICSQMPIEFVLLLTVPIVDPDKEDRNWKRPLNCLHLITSPLVCILTLKSGACKNLMFTRCPSLAPTCAQASCTQCPAEHSLLLALQWELHYTAPLASQVPEAQVITVATPRSAAISGLILSPWTHFLLTKGWGGGSWPRAAL